MRLDEQALRRPSFVPGEPVVLADGQGWELRRPVMRFTPAETEVGFSTVLDLADGSDYDKLVAAYDAAGDSGPEVVRAELALGRAVLLANYDLTPEQVGRLLRFGYTEDDDEGRRVRDEVVAVALGWGKGRPDAGDGPSPTRPADSPGATA